MWLITKYDGNHSCATPSVSQDHSKLDSDIIAGLIIGMVEQSADFSMSQIIQRVKDEYQFTVLYRKAWLGKQKALAMHRPIIDNDSDVQSLCLFWTFKPCINAWAHLKPVIQVDGTFLYGKYHHTLLIAMGQDGNKNIIPFAFTIVEGETKEAWDWSTGCLVAMEDQAVGWQPPLGHHVYCICHVASNFNTKFRSNPLMKILKNAEPARNGVWRARTLQPTESSGWPFVVGFYCDEPTVIVYELYVDPTYKLHNIVAAYSYPFHPVAGEEYWPEVPGQRLRPNPIALRPPGRPHSTGIHNEMDWKEQGEKPKCSLCRGEGHNKKKCPNNNLIRLGEHILLVGFPKAANLALPARVLLHQMLPMGSQYMPGSIFDHAPNVPTTPGRVTNHVLMESGLTDAEDTYNEVMGDFHCAYDFAMNDMSLGQRDFTQVEKRRCSRQSTLQPRQQSETCHFVSTVVGSILLYFYASQQGEVTLTE
ncbi:hypothetical protein G2W53_018445 [Senna tora]|uniref:MULE transposase domain-containing protein n=1 Tax=Senna tora TaxID=362788 RepID=A0A834TV56_9FABA|nr:hypothetical protein G2W53_018445 [Senna tora]